MDVPLICYHSKNAWFTSAIFEDWFFHHFVPAVQKFQEKVLKISAEIKPVLLLITPQPTPSAEQLFSADSKIRTMYLPPNTTSVIQSMDEGIISAVKRGYIKRYLDKILCILEEVSNTTEDARGEEDQG